MSSLDSVLRDTLLRAYDGLSVTPGLAIVAPGNEVSWDNCCEGGGQLWVRMTAITPVYARNVSDCLTMTRLSLGVGTIRCVHTMDDRGRFPTQEQMNADSAAMTRDAAELCAALSGWRPGGAQRTRLTGWAALGPQGGCAGGEWSYEVTV